jgi:hypothetical protein
VAFQLNSRLRALCVVGAVLGAVGGARAQAPGGPSSEVPVTPPAPASQNLSVHSQNPSPHPTTAVAPTELSLPQPQLLAAPAERSGWSPTVFWIAASATLITASLGGFEALHVKDLYDRANGIPFVSPERNSFRHEMRTAEVTADALLIGSLVLAVGTTILAFQIDWSGQERVEQPLAALPPSAAGRRWW